MLIGRTAELDKLGRAAADAVAGRGALVLLAGEAGVGKTRLAEAVAAGADAQVLRGAAHPTAPIPYGPVVEALRSWLRVHLQGLASCGPLRGHLAHVLPELGPAVEAAQTDRPTLFEAFRCGLDTVARRGPAIVLLDDLQWSDAATLELLGALAPSLGDMPVLVVAAYRSDELGRDHPLRRLRTDLRRGRVLRELAVEPLDASGTAAVAGGVLLGTLSPSLRRTLHDRTQGVPFFVEELAAALRAGGRLVPSQDGLALAEDAEVPVPDTIKDAVLLRTGGLSDRARAAAEAAAVAGVEFDIEHVAALSSAAGLAELLECGLLEETAPGRAAFRHALVRGALYEDVPWLSRRSLHKDLAEALERSGGASTEIAAHWLAAGAPEHAVRWLLADAGELAAVHAYRDAAHAARRALDAWPGDLEPEARADALERYALWSELAGDLAEAARALREVAATRSGAALGRVEGRLATVYGLAGDRARAVSARRVAAEAYAAAGLPGEAAAERLGAAAFLQSSGGHAEAVELAAVAAEEAARAERVDLRARALGLQGVARAKRGDFAAGTEAIRAGLSLALEHELTAEAAELYQRLGTAMETAGDYGAAQEALVTAVGLCAATGAGGQEQACLGCMAYVLRELGDWDRAAELCRDLEAGTAPPSDALVVDGILGSIHGFRGDARRARPLLERCLGTAMRLDVVSMSVDSAAALGWVAQYAGETDVATEHYGFVLERWGRSEDRHYAVWGLRAAACFFASAGDLGRARACGEALSAIVAAAGHPDALAALAHALGAAALHEGETEAAVEQLTRALELHDGLGIPFERTQVAVQAAMALAAAGEREPAVTTLRDAYRTARRLGARPVAAVAAGELVRLGEPLEQAIGRRAAAEHESAGLSRRELEVMRLVAVGRTNREIAHELFLSPRTVDMHLRNILAKLGCRSRTEATTRAGELGLLAG